MSATNAPGTRTREAVKRTGRILLGLGLLLTFAGVIPVPYTASIRAPSPEAPVLVARFDWLALLGFSVVVTGIVVILSAREEPAEGRDRPEPPIRSDQDPNQRNPLAGQVLDLCPKLTP